MKKLYDARILIYSFGLLLSSTTERFITNFVSEHFQLELIPYHIFSLFILMVLFIITNVLLKFFINSKFINKKVFGKKYIEGRWIEFIYDENNEISRYCDLHIKYQEDNIQMSGTNYDKYLNEINSFKTKSVFMDDYHLSYSFVGGEGGKLLLEGLGNIEFKENTKTKPNRYIGSFSENGTQYAIKGILIEDKAIIKKLDSDFVGNFESILTYLESKILLKTNQKDKIL